MRGPRAMTIHTNDTSDYARGPRLVTHLPRVLRHDRERPGDRRPLLAQHDQLYRRFTLDEGQAHPHLARRE